MKKLVYLISPKKINSNFYSDLEKVLAFKNVKFFQLRLKKEKKDKIIRIAKKVRKITKKFGYIISKGGITTQLLLQKGLNFKQVDLKGQILPGLSIVTSNSDQFDLPVVTFPGNLGNEKTLLESFRLMELNS